MRLSLSYKDDVKLPSKGTINTLLSLSSKKSPVSLSDVTKATGSLDRSRAFLVRAERDGVIIRGAWDTYFTVPPHIAVWSCLLGDYYRDLFRMHGALDHAHIPHGFACLTAGMLSDYVPGRPIVTVPEEHFKDLAKADVFGIALDGKALRSKGGSVGFKWRDGTFIMNVPTLPWDWTALVLGAMGTSRETTAAKGLLAGRADELEDDMARRLNDVGLVTRPELLGREQGILVPESVLKHKARLAESMRRLELSNG